MKTDGSIKDRCIKKVHWILGGIILEKTKSVPFNGTQEQEAMLHAVIDELREDKGCLMPIMQKAQEIYGYLPYEVQKMISDELE